MNIYEKLQKMRESLKKTNHRSFSEFAAEVDKVAKKNKILPLFCIYNGVATLTLVNVEDVEDKVKFTLPTTGRGNKAVKKELYCMAFDIDDISEMISLKQYIDLVERMKEKGVTEKEVMEAVEKWLENYSIK